MYQAITAKYLGPVGKRGARVRVQCDAKYLTIPWDHAHNRDRNFKLAARVLIAKLGWGDRKWTYGTLPDGRGVFVQDGDGSEVST